MPTDKCKVHYCFKTSMRSVFVVTIVTVTAIYGVDSPGHSCLEEASGVSAGSGH